MHNPKPMATKLQAARLSMGWSQVHTIARLEREADLQGLPVANRASLKQMLSSWENGHNQPDDRYRQLFRAVFGRTDRELGFSGQLPHTNVTTLHVPTAGIELVEYFRSVFDQHLRADNLLGPHLLVDVVEAQTRLLDKQLPSALGATRGQLAALACQYNEFCGWLHQDAGDLEAAELFSDRAMEVAVELDDPSRLAYVLMRKCNIAIDQNQPQRAVGLATGAMNHLQQVPVRVRALVMAQAARAHAANGDAYMCAKLLESAHAEVSHRNADADDNLASYCNEPYILMEGAGCWALLDMHDKAAPIFKQGLANWPQIQRRDRGLCMSRLAASLAAQGDIDAAVATGVEAIAVVKTAISARSLGELENLRRRLAPWRRSDSRGDVVRLNAELSTLI